MDEEACRKDDERRMKKRGQQPVKNKQMTFMDWIGEYLKREENCNGKGSGSLDS